MPQVQPLCPAPDPMLPRLFVCLATSGTRMCQILPQWEGRRARTCSVLPDPALAVPCACRPFRLHGLPFRPVETYLSKSLLECRHPANRVNCSLPSMPARNLGSSFINTPAVRHRSVRSPQAVSSFRVRQRPSSCQPLGHRAGSSGCCSN